MIGTLEERFWAKVDRGAGDACWPWVASRRRSNYGSIYDGRQQRSIAAHRVSWELHNGPIPAGLHVLHRCDNPPCVNPAHLFLGTPADNALDCSAKGRRPSKLSAHDVLEIRRLYAAGGIGQRALGKQFGVSQRHISDVVRGSHWRSEPQRERKRLARAALAAPPPNPKEPT